MGHIVRLDNVYYDKDNEKSQQKIMLEYMKAIDALTVSNEYRVRKQIADYQEKMKDVRQTQLFDSPGFQT
jgi:hypothetical protein